MWTANNWNDYEVIDCSERRKAGTLGRIIFWCGPIPQVIWNPPNKTPRLEKDVTAITTAAAAAAENGNFSDLPEQWSINYERLGLTFHLKPFSFKHTGLFPEQAANWDWFCEKIECRGQTCIKVLNLFAYTGGATLAAAKAGASVTHVDASKGMVNLGEGKRTDPAAWRMHRSAGSWTTA